MGKSYIIGYGQTKCGFYAERDMRSLISEAYVKAVKYAGIDPGDIQQMWLSHYPAVADMQETAGQVAIDAVGLGSRVGCITVEQACTSGGQAMHDATLAVESGRYRCVIVVGFGKMTDSMIYSGREGMYFMGEGPFEESGFNPFYIHAGMILLEPGAGTVWSKESGYTPNDLAAWNVMEYWYATRHPNSICYRERVPAKEEFLAHNGGGNEAAGCDGASVIVLASKDYAKAHTDNLVAVAGVAHKLESSYYAKTMDYGYGGDFPRASKGRIGYSHSVEKCWKEAFETAGLKPADIDLVNTHDCVHSTCCVQLEGMHHPLVPDNMAFKFITSGEGYPSGKLPFLTLGSARFGQPRGAQALNYVIEGYMQLKEECGSWQVPVKRGIAASMTSPGRPAAIILKREN